jgi:hypothetical protein
MHANDIGSEEFPNIDGSRVTNRYLQPLFEGAARDVQFSRCRRCWAVVWREDEERHNEWHSDSYAARQ